MELLGGWRLKLVIAASILIGCILLLVLACQLPRWVLTPQVPMIPFHQLGIQDCPVVLGKGPTGLVLKGTYRGMAVAVKRVTLPEAGLPSVFDVVAATETEEDALLVGESHMMQGCIDHDNSSFLPILRFLPISLDQSMSLTISLKITVGPYQVDAS